MKNKHIALFVGVLLLIAGGLFLLLTNMTKDGGAALFSGLPAPSQCPASGYKFVTKWGTAGTGNGQLGNPIGIATDSSGNVYISERSNNRIQKFTSNGVYIAQWGTQGFGSGQFNGLFDIAIDSSNNIYINDAGNNLIQKMSSTGSFLSQWNLASGATVLNSFTFGIGVDSLGNVYATKDGDYVKKFTPAGTSTIQWGGHGTGNGQFNSARDMATDLAGNVYVVDSSNSRIQKFTSSGAYITQWSGPSSGSIPFTPRGIALDSAGNIFVTDIFNNRVLKFTSNGVYVAQWGTQGTGNGQFNGPTGIALDLNGNVYVIDQANSRIQKFAPCTPIQIQPTANKLIRGKVYNDRNTNGVFDGTDTALANAKVSLFPLGQNSPIQTVTASSTGEYSFTNLANGTYYVGLWSETYYSNITQPATGTGIIPAHAHIYTVTITNGQGALNKDFGVVAITTY